MDAILATIVAGGQAQFLISFLVATDIFSLYFINSIKFKSNRTLSQPLGRVTLVLD
jgi:hypothetical protein